jgi:hypothetical protein
VLLSRHLPEETIEQFARQLGFTRDHVKPLL